MRLFPIVVAIVLVIAAPSFGTPTTLNSNATSFLLYNVGGATLKRFAFAFRTRASTALLLYQDSSAVTSDYLLVRLVSGAIRLNAIARHVSVTLAGGPVASDTWHTIRVDINRTDVVMTIDSQIPSRVTSSIGSLLVLTSEVYVGGIPTSQSGPFSLRDVVGVPRFVGCLDDVTFAYGSGGADDALRVVTPARVDGIVAGCVDICASNPCRYWATCVNYYSHFECDCALTGYTGRLCQTEAAVVSVQGAQYVAYDVSSRPLGVSPLRVQARLRTTWSHGLVLYSQSSSDDAWIRLEVVDSKLQFTYQLKEGQILHIIEQFLKVDNNDWYSVDIRQENDVVTMTVKSFATSPYISNSSFSSSFAPFNGISFNDVIYVGGLPAFLKSKMTSLSGFIGCLQQVNINGIDVIKNVDSSRAFFTSGDVTFLCPFEHITSINFPTQASRLEIPGWNFSLSTDFRTTQLDGILFYASTRYAEATFQVHHHNGHVHVESSIFALVIPLNISDGYWHCLKIRYDYAGNELIVAVDDWMIQHVVPSLRTLVDDLRGSLLYVGQKGAPTNRAIVPDDWDGIPGFVGCVRNVKFDGRHVDTFELLTDGQGADGVVGSCPAEANHCLSNAGACLNGGNCTNHYDRFTCDCSKTSNRDGTQCEYNLPMNVVWLKSSQSSLDTSVRVTTTSSSPLTISFDFKTTRPSGRLVTFMTQVNGALFLTVSLTQAEIVTIDYKQAYSVIFLEEATGFNNGKWRKVSLSIYPDRIRVSIDSKTRTKYFQSKIALVYPKWVVIGKTSSTSDGGIIGCLRQLLVDTKRIDMESLVLSAKGDVEKGCKGSCSSSPCQKGGTCIEGWGSYTCNCDDTPYKGPHCGKAGQSARFDGNGIVAIHYPPQYIPTTYFHTIQLGFSATSSGTLLHVQGSMGQQTHFLRIDVSAGRVAMTMKIENGAAATVEIDGDFTDGRDYGLRAHHQGKTIALEVIGVGKESALLPGLAPKFSNQIGFDVGTGNFTGCIWDVNYNGLEPLSWIREMVTMTTYDGFNVSTENVTIGSCGPTAPTITSEEPSMGTQTIVSDFPTTGSNATGVPGTEKIEEMSSLPLGMIIGISIASLVIVIVVTFVIVTKCRNATSEGSYNVNERTNGAAAAAAAAAAALYTKTNPEVTGITPYDVQGIPPDRFSTTTTPRTSNESSSRGDDALRAMRETNHMALSNLNLLPSTARRQEMSPPSRATSSTHQQWFL